MKAMKTIFLMACLVAAVFAVPNRNSMQGNSLKNNLKPSEWLSLNELENLPAVDEITLEQLEKMSNEQGADLVNKIYHLSQVSRDVQPDFVPNPNEIPATIVSPNGQRVNFNLNQLVQNAKQQPNFGDEEVTVIITGLPQSQSQTVAKATKKLVQAYMQRYNKRQQQPQQNKDYDYDQKDRTSSEENSGEWKSPRANSGNLLVIDLGSLLTSFKRLVMLDIEKTGAMIGKVLVQMTNEVDVPEEIIHVIGQGVGAHVAGVAGRQYMRLTGHKLRRITGLDPAKIYAKTPKTLTGLARGDADFVDAIHTSAYGMGIPTRVADCDFYPNGPSVAVPGATSIVEASMRATRYFAESVRPGNERNFPAVAANSLEQYKNKNGIGKRVYMGINTEYDVEGDYILQVNPNSPFGKSTPAQKQNTYHGAHRSWNNPQSQQ